MQSATQHQSPRTQSTILRTRNSASTAAMPSGRSTAPSDLKRSFECAELLNAIGNATPISANSINNSAHSKLRFHRRDALWQVERAVRNSGPLLEQQPEPDSDRKST